jgi:hypothetical protein
MKFNTHTVSLIIDYIWEWQLAAKRKCKIMGFFQTWSHQIDVWRSTFLTLHEHCSLNQNSLNMGRIHCLHEALAGMTRNIHQLQDLTKLGFHSFPDCYYCPHTNNHDTHGICPWTFEFSCLFKELSWSDGKRFCLGNIKRIWKLVV